jgi:mono/diheme cytochrome c family protein
VWCRGWIWAAVLGLAGGAARSVAGDDPAEVARWQEAFTEKVRPLFEAKCFSCHTGGEAEGEFDLAAVAAMEEPAEQGLAWDRVAARVRLNEMPPPGSPGLSDPEKGLLHRWLDTRPGRNLCEQLASDETKSWYRGQVMSRRLTHAEYEGMIAALVGVDLDPARNLPPDGAGGEGFDTTGDTLFLSPIHMERYLAAADEVVEAVLADAPPPTDSPLRVGWDRWVGDGFEPTAAALRDRLARFATAAWRRPATEDELDRLLVLADEAAGLADARPLDGLRQACKAVLVSPHFLYLVETVETGGVEPLTPRQLATRMATFIWASLPDEELLWLADEGRLADEAVLREQVGRMLRDPRSRSLAEGFGLQWLELGSFGQRVAIDRSLYPEFDDPLAADFREETVRVVHRVFTADASLLELIAAAETPLNARLAAHYGLPAPATPAADGWGLVPLADHRRGGVLTTAAVLASTSYPRRTSPVLRGQWVLGQLLGGRVPPPPPGVPPLPESHDGNEPLTLRQRLEAHRSNPSCATCHDRMDPLGFGLENYDPLGRWRTTDAGQPIDASGVLPSGASFAGPDELKARLLDRRDEFILHLSRKLLGFALGRELDEFDQCVAKRTAERLAAADHRAGLLVEEIVVSHPFRHRYHKMED